MSESLKKSVMCANKDNTKTKCAPKPVKIVNIINSRNDTTRDNKIPINPNSDLKKADIKIIVPIKKNIVPVIVEKGDIRLTSAYRQRRSFLAALNPPAECDTKLADAPKLGATKKKPRIKSAQSQSSVALARKTYSYLSRCALKSNSAITNNSTSKQTKDSGLPNKKTNCTFVVKGVARYAEAVKLLGTAKTTEGNLKLSRFMENKEPNPDPVALHAIRMLDRTLVELAPSMLHKGNIISGLSIQI